MRKTDQVWRMFAWGIVAASLLGGGIAEAQALPSAGYALQNGDVNGDLDRDMSDGVYLLGYLFSGGPEPVPLALCGSQAPAVQNGDSNGDGAIDLSDPVRLLTWLFSGAAEPFPVCVDGGGGAKNQNPRIIPLKAKAHGKSYGDWGGAWWAWALGIPAATNPVVDATGEHCDEGQSGPVWFLAGSFGGSITRTCSVPAGKTIFLALLNGVWWEPDDHAFAADVAANVLGLDPDALTGEELMRALVNW
ncbi:MAG: hypothetical protein HY721_01505, partial [Planctomycetes bacterium]|nr:hypothetical protein [Planctomycetota bacterium]